MIAEKKTRKSPKTAAIARPTRDSEGPRHGPSLRSPPGGCRGAWLWRLWGRGCRCRGPLERGARRWRPGLRSGAHRDAAALGLRRTVGGERPCRCAPPSGCDRDSAPLPQRLRSRRPCVTPEAWPSWRTASSRRPGRRWRPESARAWAAAGAPEEGNCAMYFANARQNGAAGHFCVSSARGLCGGACDPILWL